MKRIVITMILTLALTAFAIQAVEQTAFSGAGIIESTTGGFKFPDGSVQTTAAVSAQVAEVDCNVGTLQSAIDKLDKSTANTLDILGNCTEDVVVAGYVDLTLIGMEGASLTATVFDDTPWSEENPDAAGRQYSTVALLVETSNVTIHNLIINGGSAAAGCIHRSTCEFRDVTIPRGWDGVYATDHSQLYIFGSSMITTNGLGRGVAAFNSSHIIIGPDTIYRFNHAEDAGPVITGNSVGVQVQDGSFFRSDNVTITDNHWGIYAQRNATLKVYNQAPEVLGVSNNTDIGIFVDLSSTAHIGVPINDNGGDGIQVGPLSSVQDAGTTFSGNGGADLNCTHPTSVDMNFGLCP
jgi:hypothetical protein